MCHSPFHVYGYFYPRPPRGGRLRYLKNKDTITEISIHALREEGDSYNATFTPGANYISIHALREEGDGFNSPFRVQIGIFLSTPSARRATRPQSRRVLKTLQFLSTPSARRATCTGGRKARMEYNFYPRPPRGGRLCGKGNYSADVEISIHALREEGDGSEL